jgi:hypothetical protein
MGMISPEWLDAEAAHFEALSDITDGRYVRFVEAVLVALDDNAILVDTEYQVRVMTVGSGALEGVVIGVLQQLEDEPNVL